jgi:hypothetical protein
MVDETTTDKWPSSHRVVVMVVHVQGGDRRQATNCFVPVFSFMAFGGSSCDSICQLLSRKKNVQEGTMKDAALLSRHLLQAAPVQADELRNNVLGKGVLALLAVTDSGVSDVYAACLATTSCKSTMDTYQLVGMFVQFVDEQVSLLRLFRNNVKRRLNDVVRVGVANHVKDDRVTYRIIAAAI